MYVILNVARMIDGWGRINMRSITTSGL